MKPALVFMLFVGGAWAQDIPLVELQALLDYQDSPAPEPIYRLVESEREMIVADYSFAGSSGDRVEGTLLVPGSDSPTPLILFGHWMMPGSPLRNRREFLEEAKLLTRAGATCLLLDGPLIRPGVVTDPEPMNGQGRWPKCGRPRSGALP